MIVGMGKIVFMGFFVLLAVSGILIIMNSVKPPSPAPDASRNAPSPTKATPPKETKAIIQTSKGIIEMELYSTDAPGTVGNFVNKAKEGFYKNLTFHRVEDWVVQGGDPLGDGTGGGNIPVEFNDKPFMIGSVGVASRGDGRVQNDAQFFITKKDSPHLNGQYTNFGFVTKGMDVVFQMDIGDTITDISVQ